MLDLDKSFPVHPLPAPTPAGAISARELREGARRLAELIVAVLPESRERFVALTKLEESSMFAVKAAYLAPAPAEPRLAQSEAAA